MKMTDVEVAKLLKKINLYYPTFLPHNVDETIDAWFVFLQNEDTEVIVKNLMKHVKYENSPPAISDLLGANRKQDEFAEYRERLVKEQEAQEFEDE